MVVYIENSKAFQRIYKKEKKSLPELRSEF